MADWTALVAAAATGSIGTTLLGKIFDFFEKEKAHKRELRKTFFTSKLETAKDIYSQLTVLLGMMNHLRLLYTMMRDDLGEDNVDDFRTLVKDNLANASGKFISDLAGYKAGFAYGLYFDGEGNRAFMETVGSIHFSMADLGTFIKPILDFDFNAASDKAQANVEYQLAVGKGKKALDNLIKLYETVIKLIEERLAGLHNFYVDSGFE
jgi:hypothetical protein